MLHTWCSGTWDVILFFVVSRTAKISSVLLQVAAKMKNYFVRGMASATGAELDGLIKEAEVEQQDPR